MLVPSAIPETQGKILEPAVRYIYTTTFNRRRNRLFFGHGNFAKRDLKNFNDCSLAFGKTKKDFEIEQEFNSFLIFFFFFEEEVVCIAHSISKYQQ